MVPIRCESVRSEKTSIVTEHSAFHALPALSGRWGSPTLGRQPALFSLLITELTRPLKCSKHTEIIFNQISEPPSNPATITLKLTLEPVCSLLDLTNICTTLSRTGDKHWWQLGWAQDSSLPNLGKTVSINIICHQRGYKRGRKNNLCFLSLFVVEVVYCLHSNLQTSLFNSDKSPEKEMFLIDTYGLLVTTMTILQLFACWRATWYQAYYMPSQCPYKLIWLIFISLLYTWENQCMHFASFRQMTDCKLSSLQNLSILTASTGQIEEIQWLG